MSSPVLADTFDQLTNDPLAWGIAGFLLALLLVALRAINRSKRRRRRKRFREASRAAARTFFDSWFSDDDESAANRVKSPKSQDVRAAGRR